MSDVHFLKAHPFKNRIAGIKSLLKASGILSSISKNDIVGVKLHVGEIGNPYHIDPLLVRTVIEAIKEKGGNPFITDTTSLYTYARHNAIDHHNTAISHGFGYESVGAPFIVADGLGNSPGVMLKTKEGAIINEIFMAEIFSECQFLLAISHCKGHPMTAFGGAIKNLGMGCTTKRSKLDQHRVVGYSIDTDKCIGCGRCIEVCGWNIPVIKNGKAQNDSPQCMRCPICMLNCPEKAISLSDLEKLPKAVATAAATILEKFEGKSAFLNVGINISRFCDCMDAPGELISRDIGYFASTDPVAADRAFLNEAGAEIFKKANGIDPAIQLEEAERLGAGSNMFNLINLE